MKNLILTLLLVVLSSTMLTANEQDTLWLRTTTSGARDLDFTPDDKYVIAWTNSIEFWNVETATMDFIVPDIKVGGMTSDKKYLVFIQDDVPKMLDIETKEIIEGFEPPTFKPNHVKVGNDNNIFMCFNEKDSLFIWDIATKKITKVYSIETDFLEKGEEFVRNIFEYGFAGNNDDFLLVNIEEENKYAWGDPNKIKRGFSLLIQREEFKQFDSLDIIYKYKTMNLNKDVIAIDNMEGKIKLYNIREKTTINTIKYDDTKLSSNDFEFSYNDEYISIANLGYIKVFDLSNVSNYRYFNVGTYNQCRLSRQNSLLVGNVGSFLIMHPSVLTSVRNLNYNKQNDITITPNPSNQLIQISYDFPQISSYKFSLFDLTGNLISIIEEGYPTNLNYSKEYNISFLPEGAYFIKLEYDGNVMNKKFIKE